LLWLGANVVIAESTINRDGSRAHTGRRVGKERILFVPTDVGEEASVNLYHLSCLLSAKWMRSSTTTIAVLGKVVDLSIKEWDRSYHVNLRAVLMLKAFLPDMIKRDHGAFACISSLGQPFSAGMKRSRLHGASGNTLDAELEGTNVIAYDRSGLCQRRPRKAVGQLAPLMGMSVDEFFTDESGAVLSVEEAGAGFAVSVVFAEKFRVQEISSIQALKAADITFGGAAETEEQTAAIPDEKRRQAQALCETVRLTLKEQSDDWKRRSLFERQWVIRDFRKTAGMPVEEWLETLRQLEETWRGTISRPPLENLRATMIISPSWQGI
jgi:hypothetical protein